MKRTGKCPKCGCTDIIADAKAVDRDSGDFQPDMVATFRKPEALVFKEKQETTVSAWVCAGCGYIEYYADHPAAIKQGVVCGVRVESLEDPLMQKVRYLDKLIDELAKGKAMEKILRKSVN
jgi:predicted nucleic-acid-binding Zn-ribbon protein